LGSGILEVKNLKNFSHIIQDMVIAKEFPSKRKRHRDRTKPGEMIADILRTRLGLTGTKIGGIEAECGSCTVLVEGVPVLSYVYPACRVEGREIPTIEGLSALNRESQSSDISYNLQTLHPLQQAFVLQGAVQCGYCIPGQIMTAFGLLQQNPDPSEAEICSALKDTLCRCGGYPSIIRAVQEAAKQLKSDEAEVLIENTYQTAITEHAFIEPECSKVRFIKGLAQVNGHTIPLGDVVADMKSEGREPRVPFEYWAPETSPLGEKGNMHFAYSFAAQAPEVEVNTHTGEVRVIQVIAANDVGKAINPLGLQGQIEGGVVMGLGNALTEEFIVEDGQIVTDRLARYRMPNIIQTPEIKSIVVEHPTADGPYGAKCVGELSSIPTTPTITNAIYNAVGVRIR
jgi:aerobic-type carbon monoxide dehydrogenase small subunit (CoxS/CutS family)